MNTSMPIMGLASDFDGTLILTSNEFGLNKLRVTAKKFGLRYTEESEAAAKRVWGAKLIDMFMMIFPDIRESTCQEMHDYFEHLDMLSPPPIVAGAKEALAFLAPRIRGATLLTSRHEGTVFSILEFHDIRNYFCHVVHLDSVKEHKPNVGAWKCTGEKFSELGIPKEQQLYIGDTKTDWEFGRSVGVRTIVVETGFGSHLIDTDEPIEIIPSFADLPRHLFPEAFVASI